MLPDRVTDPIAIDRAIVTMVSLANASGSARTSSAAATRADAAPPKPLKAATSWGMAVICTWMAAVAPRAAPTASPAAMVVQSAMSWSTSVMTMAASIPSAASPFPKRAVRGELSRRSPKMNSAAEPR